MLEASWREASYCLGRDTETAMLFKQEVFDSTSRKWATCQSDMESGTC